MRVCLTNPPWEDEGEMGIRAGCRVPNTIGAGEHTFVPFPFTLAYAASCLEGQGVEVSIIDAIGEGLSFADFRERVVAFRPDLIVNEVSTQSHDLDLYAARELHTATGARVAVCGPHASALPDEMLEHDYIQFVLRGEYEHTLVDLTRALSNGGGVEQVEGLAYKTADGAQVIGEKPEKLISLDSLPWPHRRTLPLDRYCVSGFPAPVLFMYASRGCPYQCTFCVWPQWFRSGSYRVRTPKSVVDEIEAAQAEYGPFGSIYFDDDTFNIGKPRMLEMADEFERRSLSIPWGCNARPDLFTEETMRQLSDIGMFNIRIGVESGDPEVLKRIKKNLKLEAIGRCIELAHRFGVMVHVTFTIGLSGESWESVERTAKFARSIQPDSIAFTVTTPFPGTSYFDEVVREGYLTTRDWSRFNVVSNSVIRTELTWRFGSSP